MNIKSFLRKKQTENTGIDMSVVKDKIEKMRSNILDISKEDFELTKKLFKILNIPFYDAPLEAETMCSDLCKRGLVDAVMSEDTDVLAYGCPVFLTKIDSANDSCVQICIEDILEELEITYEQFLDLCIMFGCDYNKNIPKVGIETSFKYIKQYGSIDGIKENTKHDVSILNHQRTRELFTKYPQYEIKSVPFCGFPDFENLKEFVREHRLKISIENLEKNFVHNSVTIVEDEENIFIIEE
jgi:flap endonuclease-1